MNTQMMKFFTYQQYRLEDPNCSALILPLTLKLINQKNSLEKFYSLYLHNFSWNLRQI